MRDTAAEEPQRGLLESDRGATRGSTRADEEPLGGDALIEFSDEELLGARLYIDDTEEPRGGRGTLL